MRISAKIFLLIVFLLAVLASNTFIGLLQLAAVGQELKDVVNRDVALTEAITTIAHSQLEKAILFERLLRVSEEMAFENISLGRRQYLLSYVVIAQNGLENLSVLIKDNVYKSRAIIRRSGEKIPRDLKEMERLIADIEQTHTRYDASVSEIAAAIQRQEYELSLEDIENIEREENKLNKDIRELLQKVQGFARKSLANAKQVEEASGKTLWTSLSGSLLLSLILVVLIIRSIVGPLKKLEDSAQRIGKGDFDIHLDIASKDEVGAVAHAFNIMAGKLSNTLAELRSKNEMLANNLVTTDLQKKDLEKVNLALDTFIRTVSHDVRAPLTGIGGYAAFLEKYYENKMDEKAKSCISGIRKSAHRLNSLIEDLLSLARVSRIKNPIEQVDVHQLVLATIKRLGLVTQDPAVNFKVASDLPTVTCDKVKLGAVFFHLLDNAVKFSVKDKGQISVEVGGSDAGKYYEFFVRDNGIGIPSEHFFDIFDIFKKLHSPSDYSGTGAGLSIAKGIIEDWDGKIRVESVVGEGSTFYFTIPKAG